MAHGTEPRTPRGAAEEFGQYKVHEQLGMGGMASVHLAVDHGSGFDRVVALKRLLPHLADDEEFVRSFIREAKLASLLRHPNIVQIYELGRVGTHYFISMEYIDGRDVRQILRQARRVAGPPPLTVVVSLMMELCDALDYAHNQRDAEGKPLGLVHRDISPSNLLVTRAGNLKVIDFGIAKATSEQLRTMTGRIKGKLAYMAPEALSGKWIDARTDLFSAGVIFYELLTVRPLFASKNDYQTIQRIQKADVAAPSRFAHGCPPELDAVVLRALAKDPAKRWPSAAAMREALVDVAERDHLHATSQQVMQWIEWAFGLPAPDQAAPGSAPGSLASPPPIPRTARPTPSITEEVDDALIEEIWGGARGLEPLLSNLPDVSDGGWLSPIGKLKAEGGEARRARTTSSPAPARTPGLIDLINFSEPADSDMVTEPTATHLDDERTGVRRPTNRGIGVPERAPPVAPPPPGPPGPSPTLLGIIMPATARPGTERPGTARPPTGPAVFVPPAPAANSPIPDAVAPVEPPPPPTTSAKDPRFASKAKQRLPPAGGTSARPRRSLRVIAIVAATLVVLGLAIGFAMTRPQPVDRPTGLPARESTGKPGSGAATLDVQVMPETAAIEVDGKTVKLPVELPAGSHRLVVSAPGYRTWVSSFELAHGERKTLRFGLERGQFVGARIGIKSTPNGLPVLLDGKSIGKTPIAVDTDAGKHELTVTGEGAAWHHTLDAAANTSYSFHPVVGDDGNSAR